MNLETGELELFYSPWLIMRDHKDPTRFYVGFSYEIGKVTGIPHIGTSESSKRRLTG